MNGSAITAGKPWGTRSCPDMRSSFRVDVPSDSILELAVWFRRGAGLGGISLRDLGAPAFTLGKPPHPRIANISAGGMGLSFTMEQRVKAALEGIRAPIVLVYFKVPDLLTGRNYPMTFMAGYEIKRACARENRVELGLSLAYDGAPSGDMRLEFSDVRRFGIPQLTKWCECMQRRIGQANARDCPTGLCLDMLLRQIEIGAGLQPADTPGQEMLASQA